MYFFTAGHDEVKAWTIQVNANLRKNITLDEQSDLYFWVWFTQLENFFVYVKTYR